MFHWEGLDCSSGPIYSPEKLGLGSAIENGPADGRLGFERLKARERSRRKSIHAQLERLAHTRALSTRLRSDSTAVTKGGEAASLREACQVLSPRDGNVSGINATTGVNIAAEVRLISRLQIVPSHDRYIARIDATAGVYIC